jgi:peroxiredoxin
MNTLSPLTEGESAPEFTLKTTPDQTLSLSDFRGNPVVLIFYPADFSPVCADELALYNEILPEFESYNTQVLGISVDNVWCHLAFGNERNLRFPLLSDFHPKGEVAKNYNAYLEDVGEAARAIYLIDQEGSVAWSYIAPLGINPGADGVLKALENLNNQETRQANTSEAEAAAR